METPRHTVWWSAGAASTIAAEIHLQDHPEATLVYTDPGAEHPDNTRFRRDVEQWLGVEILVLKSEKYSDPWDVFKKTRFLVGPGGTRCTVELKKKLRQKYEDITDIQVFGYTSEEEGRATRFRGANPDVNLVTPLIEHGITKPQCLGRLVEAGIELPAMYKLGFQNANCIGCPHGGAGYWNMIREHFPEAFNKMSELEQELNHAVCRPGGKPVFLKDLEKGRGNIYTEPNIECGPLCVPESDDGQTSLFDPKTPDSE